MKDGNIGVYIISNSVNGKKYVGSSLHLDSRMRSHLLALRRGNHPIPNMQEDFDKYGEESFVFIPLLEPKTYWISDYEHFLMEILKTHDPKFGYNYKDKSGTAKYLTRDTCREVSNGFREAHKRKTNKKVYLFWMVQYRLDKINLNTLTEKQRRFVKACIESNSYKEASEKVGVGDRYLRRVVRKIFLSECVKEEA